MSGDPPSSALHPRRILVRGVNWLGDAVMSTPALLRLRDRFPQAHIALLTHEKLADLWLHHPAINEVIPFGLDEGVFAIGRRLRRANFDLALVLPNSPRSALEVWVARIPLSTRPRSRATREVPGSGGRPASARVPELSTSKAPGAIASRPAPRLAAT